MSWEPTQVPSHLLPQPSSWPQTALVHSGTHPPSLASSPPSWTSSSGIVASSPPSSAFASGPTSASPTSATSASAPESVPTSFPLSGATLPSSPMLPSVGWPTSFPWMPVSGVEVSPWGWSFPQPSIRTITNTAHNCLFMAVLLYLCLLPDYD